MCFFCPLREDTHKKSVFFSGRNTTGLPSLHQWLSGPCHDWLLVHVYVLLPVWLAPGPCLWSVRRASQLAVFGPRQLSSRQASSALQYLNNYNVIEAYIIWSSWLTALSQNSLKRFTIATDPIWTFHGCWNLGKPPPPLLRGHRCGNGILYKYVCMYVCSIL